MKKIKSENLIGNKIANLLESKDVQVIDLSVLIAENNPSWSTGGQPFLRARFNWFDGSMDRVSRAPYNDFVYIIEEHTGTHCDAGVHQIPPTETNLPHAGQASNNTTDKIPIKQTMGPAVVIDCTDLIGTEKPGISPVIHKEKIIQWEKKYGDIKSNNVVLLYTGWTDAYFKPFPEGYKLDQDCRFWAPIWGRERTIGFPAPSAESMEYLVQKKVKHVGIDTPSMGMIQDDNSPHWVGLENGMVFVEKLCNLGKLPPRGSFYIFLGIKVKDGTGAPGRAIAIIEKLEE
jgi:isatin hydrolase